MACSYQKLDPVSQQYVTVYPPTCFKCKYYDSASGTYQSKSVTWRLMYPNCSKVNALCNPSAGAYLAAISVCGLHIW